MIILVAVIVGYTLGAMPFVIPKILERRDKKFEFKAEEQYTFLQEEIQDEWLNGPKQVNQEDIYNEYVTGKETVKGD